jgi:Bacterial Ig-like domain (group 3)/FG-GAP-like repeat
MNRLLRLAAFPLSLALSVGSSHASTLAYQSIVTMSTGTVAPHYLAVGDFNADGKPDLAIADFAGKTVSIYLNKGGASLGAPVVTTLSIDNTVGAMVSGDFNEDGKADLAVATVAGTQVVIVLLSNGDGTFAVQPAIPGSFGFLSGKVADFNGDGHADLYLGGNGSPYLFLGKGDGSFTQGSVGKGSFPGEYTGVSAGDFNGDKKLDGIAVDFGGNGVGSLDFFPGDGNSLGNATVLQPPFFQIPATIDVADLNNDGKLDLLISGSGAAGGILGNGDGTFQLAANQVIPIYAEDAPPNGGSAGDVLVLAADLNQDGHPDAVVLDATIGLLSLSLNDGTGAFPPTLNTPYTYQFAAQSYGVAAADFNGDGLPDIVVSNANAKTVSFLLSVKSLTKPTVALTSSAGSAIVGSALTFKAAITGGTAAASGTVSLLDGSTQIAQQTLDGSASADFDLSNLGPGVHTLTLAYSGDTNYAAGTSAPLNQSITDFQLAIGTTSQTVSAGSAANYPLTLTGVAGFTGNVTFSCSGLPALATCNAPTLTVGASTATETVTVNTTAATTAQGITPEGITYACLLLGCVSLYGLKRRRHLWAVLPLFLLSLTWGPVACGGSSKHTVPGTPSGTSTITITATTTQNGVTVTHASTATLIVQ